MTFVRKITQFHYEKKYDILILYIMIIIWIAIGLITWFNNNNVFTLFFGYMSYNTRDINYVI